MVGQSLLLKDLGFQLFYQISLFNNYCLDFLHALACELFYFLVYFGLRLFRVRLSNILDVRKAYHLKTVRHAKFSYDKLDDSFRFLEVCLAISRYQPSEVLLGSPACKITANLS